MDDRLLLVALPSSRRRQMREITLWQYELQTVSTDYHCIAVNQSLLSSAVSGT